MSEARPPASRLARADSRPILVTALVVGWMLLSGSGALRAIVVLGNAAATSALGTTDPMAKAAAAAPDLVSDETRQVLAQRAQRASLERALAIPLLLVATLGVVGAVALLRRRTWSRALLATVGVLALGISAFYAYRSVGIAASPVAGLEAEPDVQNALALLRAAAGISLALQSIPLVVAMSLLRHPIVRDYLGVATRLRSGPDPLLIVAACAVLVAAGAVLFSKSRAPAPAKSAPVFHPPEPAETFRWSDQPITFSPPPGPWTRERHAEGGRKGVSFTRYATPPSRIIVAEAFVAPPPRTVEEVLPQFRLTPEKFPSVQSITVGEPAPAAVAGHAAFQTDYTMRERSMQHRGREFLTVVSGHVFVFTLLGPESDLRPFENLVASVRFTGAEEAAGGAASPAGAAATSPGEPSGGEVTAVRVGEQRVTVRIPAGWEHVDYGRRQEFRRGEARFALFDAGPAQPGPAGEVDDPDLMARALRTIDHDPHRREVASKTPIQIGGRDALAVDTWEPLSHAYRERFYFALHAGSLLVAAPVMGRYEDTKAPLEALVRSIRFGN